MNAKLGADAPPPEPDSKWDRSTSVGWISDVLINGGETPPWVLLPVLALVVGLFLVFVRPLAGMVRRLRGITRARIGE